MNLSLLCVICILQFTSADDRRQIGIHGQTRGAGADDGHGLTRAEATAAGDRDDGTRSGMQGGRIFRLSRSRARLGLNTEKQNIREDSDVLSPDWGRARKGARKGIRKTAKKKGNKDSQGQLKQQNLSTLAVGEPVPIVKVSD